MRRNALLIAFVLAAPLALAACPDRKDSIEVVGGAAGRQMDVVRGKMEKNEQRMEDRAAEVNKAND